MTTIIYEEVSKRSEEPNCCVSGVLKKLGVSTSGYYSWSNRDESKTAKRKKQILAEIKEIHEASYKNYGAPKITHILKQRGHKISERTVTKYMKEQNIRARYIAPYTRTTISESFNQKLTNILNQDFCPTTPNQVWCTDITYIWTQEESFVYLTSVMDLYSRSIIGWTLSRTMEVQEVLTCIEKAKLMRQGAIPQIIHSDRGSQFVSNKYHEITKGMQLSYSDKGVPYDNAVIESFHSLIKREWLNHETIQNYEHAYQLVFEYIETFYNTMRIHSHCAYHTPFEFENIITKNAH